MLGQPGSTPLDLFWDIMEEVERDIRLKRNLVLDILDEKRFEIREQTTLEDLESVLKSDHRTAQYDRETIAALFEKLREKIVKRIEDDRHQQERHARRKMDALRSVMKHLEPPIDVTDTWEQVRPRIQKMDEFIALDPEELRRTAFDKFIRRLKDKHDDREKERERKEKDRGDRDRGDRVREKDRDGRAYRGDAAVEPPDLQSLMHMRQKEGGPLAKEKGDRAESVYDRERREREEERERLYRTRGDDEYRTRRRARPLSPTEESDDGRRDSKRSRRERTPKERTPRARTPDERTPVGYDYPRDVRSPTIKASTKQPEKMQLDEKAEESEEGEIAE
ncbi:uncharacterized protein LAJ45_00288 [Morchella importuna]|uniref:uncharacterized protein n=1 Tax=Morchella importuna TaxID=1174673 RepID=UPI001E8D40D3|nr:uncharacterized protein LAJ45_00288 [Morchella importuna]KAH8155278.1 hypothetical protein LAJ45_00288 [Morchella importuna]